MSRRLIVEADGGSRGNPGPAGYGTVVRDAETGAVLVELAAAIGRVTNNVAEYEGLIAGLRACGQLSPSAVDVRMDSKLVVEQMSGRWQVKHPSMRPLADTARELVRGLGVPVSFSWIPRARNSHADRLANEAMDAATAGRSWSAGESAASADAVVEPPPTPANRLPGWQDRTGPPTTTLLLRHGQTTLSVDKRFSGLGGQELTAHGAAQAVRTAEHLAASERLPDAVVSSPLRRAAQTAAAVATALGVAVETEEGLRETDFGDWEGYTFAEVRERWPAELDAWLADPAVAPPYGESFTATTTRVQAALSGLLARHAGRTLVVVSHVTPVKTLLRLALTAPPVAMYRMHLDLCSLSEVQWYADGPAVVRSLNDTCHLAGLAQ